MLMILSSLMRLVIVAVFLIQLVVADPALAQETRGSTVNASATEETHKVDVQRNQGQTNQEQYLPPQGQDTPSVRPNKEKPNSAAHAYSQPPNPYDREAIERFDQELYGAGR